MAEHDPALHRLPTPQLAEQPLMRIEDVAARLAVTKAAAYAMIEKGQVPGTVRLSRRVRVVREIFDAWLASLASGTAPGTKS